MTWEILYTDEYEGWFLELADAEQIDVQAMVDVLEIKAPNLGRPSGRHDQGHQEGQKP
ncbi:hypothetical protein [uncultured Amphritea sp.]|uniref:hypothetical protein n=1 Tax=uncultured Amphritea sp. TaxID=981605 RepID=UPI0025F6CB6B|nr:hypothetical protein [uncultured Amphritea sp.]